MEKKPEGLNAWLQFTNGNPPDIVGIGIQELDMTTESLLLREMVSRSAPWNEALLQALNQRPDLVEYSLVASKQLVGLLLCIFVNKKHLNNVSEVQFTVVATGTLGVMGNKGAVAIRFKFYDSTFCIINAHFNAHQTNVQRRNQDYHEIFNRIVFYVDNQLFNILDHDHIFWLGDLNYRIDLSDNEVRAKIAEKDWNALLAADQLVNQMKAKNVFPGWQEGVIDFAPTYKYVIGTNEYDNSDGTKRRIPAWCDRILWRGTNIKQLRYGRYELLTSDHRPVFALFQVEAKSIVQAQRQLVYQDIVKQLDKLENDIQPDAVISAKECDFGQVRFGVPVSRSITISNTGKVICRFRFIAKPNDKHFCKPWLRITPAFGMLAPGESTEIVFVTLVDKMTAPSLNSNKEKLDDILILHLENGKDFFISVSGTYMKSSFGCSLAELVRYPQPIRDSTPMPEIEKFSKLRVPKELWRIVDYIYKNCMDEEDLFLESGDQEEMERIREALDTGAEFGKVDNPHSMAETLLTFLGSLSEPVIPSDKYRQVLEASQSYAHARQMVSTLPEVHFNVFYYLMAFLRVVLQHEQKNKLTPEKLALVFSNVLIPQPSNLAKEAESVLKKKTLFIQYFLSSSEELQVI